MKIKRAGFTLIEVSLFLAVTALLFLGVTLGVRGSIFQQRYNDSVQSLAEFLRSAYSETSNVEHTGSGRSDLAVYGKLLTFGETYDLAGKKLAADEYRINSYTVVGGVEGISAGDVLDSLKKLGANVVVKDGGSYKMAGIVQEYIPKWGAGIQTTGGYSGGKYTTFKGAILIVRHPQSGTIYTYYKNNGVIEVNNALRTGTGLDKLLTNVLNATNFKITQVDICVNPAGAAKSNQRRDVRIVNGARNASSVQVINQDSGDNQCL